MPYIWIDFNQSVPGIPHSTIFPETDAEIQHYLSIPSPDHDMKQLKYVRKLTYI